jgi:hypothetical protein
MSPSPPVTAARNTRATTATVLKTRDEITKIAGMEVKDAASARAHLMSGAYIVKGVETSMDMLSTIALQLSQMQKLPKPAMEAFRALAFLIDEAHQKQLLGTMTYLVEKSLDTVPSQPWMEFQTICYLQQYLQPTVWMSSGESVKDSQQI